MLKQATARQEKSLLDPSRPPSEQALQDTTGPSTRDKFFDDPVTRIKFDDPTTVGVLSVGPMSVDCEQPAEPRSSLGRVSFADRRASVGYNFCNAGEEKGFVAATPRIEGMADIGEGDKGFVAATPRIESMADVAQILESSCEAPHPSIPASHGVYNV